MRLLKFSSSWCQPCKALAEMLPAIMADFPLIEVENVDVEQQPEVAQRYNIRSLPTLVLLSSTGVVLGVSVGASPESRLRHFLSSHA